MKWTPARDCAGALVGSALAARESKGLAVATGIFLVGIADSRDCDKVTEAANMVEGKRELFVVGFAFKFTFAYAVEFVVGIEYLFDVVLVGTEGTSRKCEVIDLFVVVGIEGSSRKCEEFDMVLEGIEGTSRRCEVFDLFLVGFALAAR
jgi:hypothetical protein